MSTAEIINIAGEYCSLIIELNLLFTNAASQDTITTDGGVVLPASEDYAIKSYISQRAAILKDVRKALKNQHGFELLNDEQLDSCLFEIYCEKLDNDKYGINKRA